MKYDYEKKEWVNYSDEEMKKRIKDSYHAGKDVEEIEGEEDEYEECIESSS